MLDSLQIKNFRIFRDLRLEKLGRVNLIVGKNNSGKTCLLEALRVYGHSGNPRLLYELVSARNEDISGLVDDDLTIPEANSPDFGWREAMLDPVRNLFHGYRFPSDFHQAIEIGPGHEKAHLRLFLRAYTQHLDDNRMPVYIPLDARSWVEMRDIFKSPELAPILRLVVELCRKDSTEEIFSFSIPHRDPVRRLRSALWQSEFDIDVQFVPVKQMKSDEIARLWDRVVVRPKLRAQVVNALRLIDPSIKEIVMVQGTSRDNGPVPILLYDEDTRLPLKSLGDGVTHLFHMILATVSTSEGMVLFDEFENGLHWSVQPMVWKTMFELAVDLDLQIFATTHSWDCVQAFKDVAMEHQAEAMLFHLGRSVKTSDRGKLIVTEYDKKSLDLATRAGLEVR